jgi:hypothetical protein
MIAPLLFATTLDYTAKGGQPPSALPPKSKTLSITKRKRGEEDSDRHELTLTRHAGNTPQGGMLVRIPGGILVRIHSHASRYGAISRE